MESRLGEALDKMGGGLEHNETREEILADMEDAEEDFERVDKDKQSGQQKDSIADIEGYEYVMIFSPDMQASMEEIKKLLLNNHLLVQEQSSRDGDEVFLFISASPEQLEIGAEKLKMKKVLKERYGGGRAEFTSASSQAFVGSESAASFFTSYEKVDIIWNAITGRHSRGGAQIDVYAKVQAGEISQCFALNTPAKKERLMKIWVQRSWRDWRQPIESIREYYGEYITMYFAFLGHYTSWLIVPSVVGAIIFALSPWIGFDNATIPFYCIFLILWATLYLDFWKRKNSEMVLLWDTRKEEFEERIRPQFEGEKRYGGYYEGEFVSLDPDTISHPPFTFWAPKTPRYWKFGAGSSMLATFLTIVIIGTLGIFVFRLFMRKTVNSTFGSIMAGILNAVFILFFNQVYRRVAVKLTDWENYRTEQEHENSFIVKNFLFQFVNSYVSLFYIAFMKGRYRLFNYDENDTCLPDCMSELTIQLGSIFLTNIFIGQANEVLIPWLKGKFSLWMEDRNVTQEASIAEQQSKLWPYENAFDDYNELVIQFGYVTLFAAAFPIAPLCAFINNIVEMRTDAVKLMTGFQRPNPRSAVDIGNWEEILEIMSYLAVLTNVGLICFTSEKLHEWLPMNSVTTIWVAVIAEHVILVIKWLLSRTIPDTPSWVRKTHARRKFLKLLEEERNDELKQQGISVEEGEGMHAMEDMENPSAPLIQ